MAFLGCVWILDFWTFDGSWIIFLVAKDGVPSRVESMCWGVPRLESPFPSSLSVSVGFFLGERRGLPFSITEMVCLQNIAQNVLRDAGWRSQMLTKWCFPPHPSCTYLQHNLPHHTIPKDAWWPWQDIREWSWLLCLCRLFHNRQLGQFHESLIASGMGYQWFDLGAIIGEFCTKAFDTPCHERQTVLLPCHLQLLEGHSLFSHCSCSSFWPCAP